MVFRSEYQEGKWKFISKKQTEGWGRIYSEKATRVRGILTKPAHRT